MYNKSENHYGKIPDMNDTLHDDNLADGYYHDGFGGEKEPLEIRVARYASFATLGIFTMAVIDRLWPTITKTFSGKKKRQKRR